MTSLASGQVVLFSGAGAQASPGGGSRSAVLIGGQYLVFFNDGTGVVYRSSLDAVTFSPPQPASTTAANLGFSVARSGNKLGLVWAKNDAAGYELWYREASIAGAAITFGAPTLVSSHATDTRGYQATLAYSAAGTPYIAAFEYGQPYTGPIGPGCGSLGRYRPINYVLQGSWQMRGYCNNFDTVRDPNSIAIAPSGNNMIVLSAIDANLSTAIVNEAGELGEPWHMVFAVDHLIPGQMSAAQSLTVPTDVHAVYRDGAGAISYSRQDGTQLDLNAQMLDTLVLHAAARHPAVGGPTTTAGCYTAVYTAGNTIYRRTFKDTIATVSPESISYTTTAAPANVSLELDAGSVAALIWQDGNSIMFGFAGEPVSLTAAPDKASAGGSSVIAVTSTPFRDACGVPIAAGSLVTVTTTAGSIADVDASSEFEGTQVHAEADGTVSFTVRTGPSAASAIVAAMPVTGGSSARVDVEFTGVPIGCGDGILDVAGGEQCDSSGVDTATCNAIDCQTPRCGDGYVNVAAEEQCEAGALCDVPTCKYTFTIGGGCAGCRASRPDATLLVFVVVIALRRRRRGNPRRANEV